MPRSAMIKYGRKWKLLCSGADPSMSVLVAGRITTFPTFRDVDQVGFL